MRYDMGHEQVEEELWVYHVNGDGDTWKAVKLSHWKVV